MNMDPETLGRALRDQTRFDHLVHVQRCASTQDLAERAEPPGDLVAWSDEQSAGRGRMGRSWDSTPSLDLALTFRVILPDPIDPHQLAAALPVAILSALETISGLELDLKWPNDIQWQGRKLCGVLIDARGNPVDRYLIGVGVNVNRSRFPSELQDLATSLALATGEEFDRPRLVLVLAEKIDAALKNLASGDTEELEALFRERLGCVDHCVQLGGDRIDAKGRVTAIDLDTITLDGDDSYALAHVTRLQRL